MPLPRNKTTLIVIHRAEIITDEYHFIVDTDGHIHQRLDFNCVASHAVAFNSASIAIAFFGNFAALEHSLHPEPTGAQIEAGIELINNLRWWYGSRVPIKGHSELGPAGTRFPEKLILGHTCPGERGNLLQRLRQICDTIT